jgi:hypothetical protein
MMICCIRRKEFAQTKRKNRKVMNKLNRGEEGSSGEQRKKNRISEFSQS